MPDVDERERLRLSKLLRACREGLDLSQKQVADYLRVERSTYSKYEGGRIPDLATLLELSALYRMDLSVFAACFKRKKRVPELKKLGSRECKIIQADEAYLPMTEDEKRLLTYYRNSIRKNVINDAAKAVMIEDADGPWFASSDED